MNKFLSIYSAKFSNKRLIFTMICIFFIILIYLFGVLPILEFIRNSEEEVKLKKNALLRFDEYLRSREALENELKMVTNQYESITKKLLPGETPQLGAANLQEIIKRISEKNGISIRSFRPLESKESLYFSKISIQIEFNPTNSMLNLGQFIYDIENFEKELVISEMDLSILNPRTPTSIRGNLVVSGFIKSDKTKIKEKGGKI